MMPAWRLRAVIMVALTAAVVATPAGAACTINAGGLSMTPLTASTGTFTPPTAPSAQSVTFTISGTYNGGLLTGGTCTIALSFNRTSLPASMSRTGGGANLPYTIQTLPVGGTTLLHTGGGAPTTAQRVQLVVGTATLLQSNIPFSRNLTVYFLAQPTTPQREGSYSDGSTARLFNIDSGNNATALTAPSFTVSGSVAKACTIGGVSTPGADTASIPIGTTGAINIAPIAKSYVSVVCNALTNLQITSQIGAVKRTAAAFGGFTNQINYSASATYGGATSTLNTATIGTATGAEPGSVGTTSSSTSSGTLSLTITPQQTVQPLAQGSYSDTLRITMTPQ